MSSGAPNYSFENLTHSGLIKLYSKDDKNISFQVDVFGGNVSFVIFTPGGGRPWKLGIPQKVIATLAILLRKMRAEPRPCREAIMVNVFDAEAKRMKQVGQLGIGLDETLTLQLDISHTELNGRHMFPIKPDSRFDFSNTSLSEKEAVQSVIDSLLTTLTVEVPTAVRLSSFKRAPGGGGGQQRGGFNNAGGNRNFGGNSGGGNNYNNRSGGQQAGSFGGGGDVTDDLVV